MKTIRGLFALAVILFVVACALPLSALTVTMTIKVEGQDKPIIVGSTNLPDGTELMVTITRRESAYMAQSNTRVSNGAFRAGPFSQKSSPLNPGIYRIEVSSPLTALQPAGVRAVIGQDGSNLGGPLAKRSKFGGKVVEYRTSFKVGSGISSTAQDRPARAQEAKDRHAWWLQSCKDNCNLVQGVAHRRGEAFDWGRCYNKCVSDEPNKK